MDHLDASALSRALEQHELGTLTGFSQIERGNWQQNVAVETTTGRYVFRCQPLFEQQFQIEAEAVSFLAASRLVPVPSPYVIDRTLSVFPWEYAVMPLLEGVPIEVASITPENHLPLARAIGELLGRLHYLKADSEKFPLLAGQNRTSNEPLLKALGNVEKCVARGFLTETEARAVETQLKAWAEKGPPHFRNSFVHGDFQSNNLLVSATDPDEITALLDFSGSHFGHPAEDLPRQLCIYLDLDSSLALSQAFLDGYGRRLPDLPLFLLCERLDLWVFIKDMRVDWVDPSLSFTDWLAPYLEAAQRWSSNPPS
jgi:hygromycin-B 7''-O-kinase